MRTYKITDPESGITLKLKGDSPPTESEIQEVFNTYYAQQTEAMPIGRPRDILGQPLKAIGSSLAGKFAGCLLYTSPSPRDRG